MDDIAPLIISKLVFDEEYTRKVIPFLKEEYFQEEEEKLTFDLVNQFLIKYNKLPTKEALLIDLSNKTKVSQQAVEKSKAFIEGLKSSQVADQWLLDQTESFCQKRAIYNALMKSVEIYGDKTGKQSLNAVPKLLQDALGVSFDTRLGHNYLADYQARFDYYHKIEHKVPFDIAWLNLVTGGGVSNKTLNIFSAGTGGGKSLSMCHFAGYNLICGKNVLYLSLEMCEEEISKRVDANVLDIPISNLALIPWETYEQRIGKLRERTTGKLIVREYPPTSASAAVFRNLLNELRLKQDFVPDVIYIDYMNICASSRTKLSNTANHLYVRAISEELRGLAVEFDRPIITASQFNKEGYTSSDPGLENSADAFSSSWAADFTCAIINSEELGRLGQTMFKQTGKNRYADPTQHTRGVIGIDRAHMRLFDVDPQENEALANTDTKSLTDAVNKSFLDKFNFKKDFA